MDPFHETTITNPTFQDMGKKSHKQPLFDKESRLDKQKTSTQSESKSGVKRTFLVLMAMACLLSVTSFVLTTLVLCGKIPTYETWELAHLERK